MSNSKTPNEQRTGMVEPGVEWRLFLGDAIVRKGQNWVWSFIFITDQVEGYGSTKSLRILGGPGCDHNLASLASSPSG